MSIWCFDPGQTTGVAEFSDTYKLLRHFEVTTWEGIDGLFSPGDTIVYEKITVRHPSFNPIGLEVSGVIKYLCWRDNYLCIAQSPSMITGIQKWPIFDFSSIKSQHERDAISHGIVFITLTRKCEIQLPEELRKRI